jgi:hypothetical protein
MARPAFISELRAVQNICTEHWPVDMRSPLYVHTEWYSDLRETADGPGFNRSFSLEFIEEVVGEQAVDCMPASVHPNVIGVELMLTVDEKTRKPLMMELLGGEALGPEDFQDYTNLVKETVRQALTEEEGKALTPCLEADIRNVCRCPIETMLFARVLVIRGDICFLFCPFHETPGHWKNRLSLRTEGESAVACYAEGTRIVCVEGWVRSGIERDDRKMVVLWDRE